jgi:hypoxanthine phosphoribosyltransferase
MNFGPSSCAPDELPLLYKKMAYQTKKAYYSWEHYHSLVLQLKFKITRTPNIIVSIGKGGSIPGVILAEAFECNNLNLGLKSYKGQSKGMVHEYQSINHYEALRDANVLIIDDLADSGETFQYAVDRFIGNGCERIETASVFYKNCSKFKPNYFTEEIDSNIWIVHPWETQNEG